MSYDSSVNTAPSGFKPAVEASASYFGSILKNQLNVSITVGYGQVPAFDGSGSRTLPNGAIGESYYSLQPMSYSPLRAALLASSSSSADSSAYQNLPVVDPAPDAHQFWLTSAQYRNLGFGATPDGIDAAVGFSNTASFDFDPSDGISSGSYDFQAIVKHEFSEVLGRLLLVGTTAIDSQYPAYSVLDLFHYSAPMQRQWTTGSSAGYFSIDSGQTIQNIFNDGTDGGDAGDWRSGPATDDAGDAFSNTGVLNVFSQADINALDLVGWATQATGPVTVPAPLVQESAAFPVSFFFLLLLLLFVAAYSTGVRFIVQ